MLIKKNKFNSVFVGIVLALLSFEAQILTSILTTTRLSLILLLLLNFLLFFKGVKFSISKYLLVIISFFGFIILWCVINIFYSLVIGSTIYIIPLSSIILIMVSVIMLSFIIEKNNIDIYIIIRTLWLIGSLTIYITLLLLIYNAEFNIFDSNVRLSILKRYFNDTLVSGTSRFFYGLIVLNIFSIGYTFGYLRKVKKYTRLVSSINIVIITILLVFANSRQNLLLLIFVIIVGKLMSYRLVSVIKVVFKISIVLGLLLFILSATTNIIPLIKEKYIERTTKQLKQGSERTETYKNAIDDMLSYPIFGVGLGNFQKNHGITTHNGYLWVGSELGIFPLLIYFIFILWVILTYNKVKYLKNDYQKIAKLLFVFIIGYLLISNNFNELFKDYIFYSVLILYLSLFNEVNISEEKKLINKHQKKIK